MAAPSTTPPGPSDVTIGDASGRSLKQLVLGRKDIQDLSDAEQDLAPDLMTVNMGPSHPAMHGTVRIVLTVEASASSRAG